MGRSATAVRNRPQQGAFTFQMNGRRVDVRVSTFPRLAGEKLVLRETDKERPVPGLAALGYDADTVTRLTRALDQPSGVVLVTGPVVQYLQTRRSNIVSVEDPVEHMLSGVRPPR